MKKNLIKKTTMVLLLFIIVSTIFSCHSFADGNSGSTGGPTLSGGSANNIVILWKVSVYIGDSQATKNSPLSHFNKIKTVYYACKNKNVDFYYGSWNFHNYVDLGGGYIFQYARDTYQYSFVGSSDKLQYAHGARLSVKRLRDYEIIANADVPYAELGPNQSTYYPMAKSYFEDNAYSRIQEIDSSIGKDDAWILIYEPAIYDQNKSNSRNSWIYTPTEYALAENLSGDGKYNVFSRNTSTLVITSGANFLHLADGSWIDIGEKDYPMIWKNCGTQVSLQNDWSNIKNSVVKYGGCGMAFSKAFEYPDYTGEVNAPDTAWENEVITVSATVSSTNTALGGSASVSLSYNGQNAQILDANPKIVTFSEGGPSSQTVSWKVNVGTYPAKSEDAQRAFTINISSDRELVTDNNTSKPQTITLIRDFSVSQVNLDKTECFENDTVKATFSVYNNNPYLEYKGVPVDVYLYDASGKTTKVGSTVQNFDKKGSAGGTKKCTININVGTVTQNSDQKDKIYAVVNASNMNLGMGAYHERNMQNNRNSTNGGGGDIRVKRIIDLSVSVVSSANQYPNCARSVYPGGNTTAYAVTSCIVGNHSRFNLYSDDAMNDTITVHFLVNGSERGKKTVNIPSKGTNLVYFKWAVPSNPGKVTLTAYIEWNVNEEYHPDRNDNRADLNGEIIKVDYHKTADTSLKTKKSDSYSGANAYKKLSPYVARWSQWVYVGGGAFEKVDYALSTENETKLYPMNSENGELSFASGSTIAAGSAFALNYKYNIVTETYGSRGGKYSVPDDAYTFEQNAVASFPEFNYKTVSDCRTLYLSNQGKDLRACNFEFDANASADGNQKVHFTPINMPNGTYKVGILGKDIWTPAGMIYANSSAALNIGGSIYNDFYVS